jgi:hypothetical protein
MSLYLVTLAYFPLPRDPLAALSQLTHTKMVITSFFASTGKDVQSNVPGCHNLLLVQSKSCRTHGTELKWAPSRAWLTTFIGKSCFKFPANSQVVLVFLHQLSGFFSNPDVMRGINRPLCVCLRAATRTHTQNLPQQY